MDIEDLRAFVEIADAGGVTSGARRLGVSKSVASRRLARLEQELGVQLVARTTRGAGLTEAGVSFRDHAAKVCAEIDAARDAIHPTGEVLGLLRISAPLTFGCTHLAPVLAKMARLHPLLHVHTYYTDRFVDLVAEGFDCAIRVGWLRESNLMARRVGPLHGSLVASPLYVETHGSPESPDDLLLHEALMQGTETWRFLDGAETVAVHVHGKFKADSGTALLAAAVEGVGIACLPDLITEGHVASGALVRLMTRYPPPTAGIYVVRPTSPHPVRKVRILTEMLIECFGHSQGASE